MDYKSELAALRKAYPRYSKFFLDYEKIENALSSNNVEEITGLLRHELSKVNDFADLEWEVLNNEIRTLLRKSKVENKESLDNLAEGVLAFSAFVDANSAGFASIIQRCNDTQAASYTWFLPSVESAPFRQRNLDAALGQLGALYARWREKHHPQANDASRAIADMQEDTFFVSPEKVMRVKALIVRYLRPRVKEGHSASQVHGPSYWRSDPSSCFDGKRHVTHVYFENAQGNQYAERQRRQNVAGRGSGGQTGAAPSPFRCRWTGKNTGAPEFDVHVDVDAPARGASDITLTQLYLPSLVAGQLDAAATAGRLGHSAAQQQHLANVVASVRNQGLKPFMSTSFFRSTFGDAQAEDDAATTLDIATVDEELCFQDEESAASGTVKSWCRAADARAASKAEGAAAPSGGVVLPNAVVRIRSSGTLAPLLHELSQLGVMPVPGFSKALHGTAMLRPALAVPLPPWYQRDAAPSSAEIGRGSATQAAGQGESSASGATPKKPMEEKRPGDASTVKPSEKPPKIDKPAPAKKSAPQVTADTPLRMDSKTPLANERTLLRWLRSAVLLAGMSALLSSYPAEGAQINGILLAVLALVFVFGPLSSYRQRSRDMSDPAVEKPRQEFFMEHVLAGSLIFVLALALSVEWIARSDDGDAADGVARRLGRA